MPYIKSEKRAKVQKELLALRATINKGTTIGEMNYLITSLLHRWIVVRGGVSYAVLNATVGVLECAKLELYRQIAAPYEEIKKEENGPVSGLDSS